MVDLRADKVDSVKMSLTIVGKDEWCKLIVMLVCCEMTLFNLLRESRYQGLHRVIIITPRRSVYSGERNIDNHLLTISVWVAQQNVWSSVIVRVNLTEQSWGLQRDRQA